MNRSIASLSSWEEQTTATAAGLRPTPRPLFAEAQGGNAPPCETAGQASGFRPALSENVGPFSTGQEWATWTPDLGRTASRLPTSICEFDKVVDLMHYAVYKGCNESTIKSEAIENFKINPTHR
jgi:hypothetical protein